MSSFMTNFPALLSSAGSVLVYMGPIVWLVGSLLLFGWIASFFRGFVTSEGKAETGNGVLTPGMKAGMQQGPTAGELGSSSGKVTKMTGGLAWGGKAFAGRELTAMAAAVEHGKSVAAERGPQVLNYGSWDEPDLRVSGHSREKGDDSVVA